MRSILLISAILALFSIVYGIGIDTGMIEWKQPNSATFTGKAWGDEFRWWMETEDGYRFVQSFDDGYYYYATLDGNGEFAPSEYKVGIDDPPAGSYQLERSAAREVEIDSAIVEFEEEIEQNYQEYLQKRADALAAQEAVNYHVGVILVEFSDTTHYIDTRTNPTRPDGYYIKDFENMLFGSPGDWFGGGQGQPPSPHPESDQVFGSMRDYWYQQSIPNGVPGDLQVTGQLVNPPVNPSVPNPIPQWIHLDTTKAYFDSLGLWSGFFALTSRAVDSAKALGWLPQDPYKPNGPYDHLIIIYAGETTFDPSRGLNPAYTGKKHTMGERTKPFILPQGPNTFSHIGVHAHEFGHRLFMLDNNGAASFGLMASQGAFNGPNRNHSCPSAVEPWERFRAGWVTPVDTIDQNITNFVVEYDYLSPKFYMLKSLSSPSNEYFLIETRGRTGFDLYTPYTSNSFNDQDGALLIWRNGLEVIPADNNIGLGWIDDYFPTTDSTSQDWNDETIPNSSLINGQRSHIALQNIVWNYETNPQDTATTISELNLNDGLQLITNDTSWSGTIILDRDIAITDDAVLSIEPGTLVQFDSSSKDRKIQIYVESGSQIEAVGTTDSHIEFKSALANPNNNDWGGFLFSGGGEVVFTYVDMRHTENAITTDFFGGNLEISSSSFKSTVIFIGAIGSNSFIKNSEFVDSCIVRCWSSSILISGNHFQDSYLELHEGDMSLIANNIMVGDNESNEAIKLYTYEDPLLTDIINNTISFYSQAIIEDSGSYALPTIKNNIFFQNSASGNLPGTVKYNCFWNNDSSTYTPPDTTNITANPLFVDAGNGDFHLKSNSPCIDKGNPNDEFENEPEPNGNRINMGAYGNTPEATLSFDVIAQEDFTANTTWEGYVNIIDDISTNQYSLTVEPGTKVLFDDGVSLSINGDFTSDGHPPLSSIDSIEFSGYRETDEMGGVFIDGDGGGVNTIRYTQFKQGDVGLHIENANGEEDLLEHLLFENNNTGLYLDESDIDIINSIFKNNQSGLISDYSDVIVSECNFDSNSTQGLYLFNSSFEVYENTFQNNNLRGVYFQYSSDGLFYDNTVLNNGEGTGAEPSDIKGGLVFYQSEPIVSTNFITQNKASGIYSLSSSYPIMIEEGINCVSENGDSPEDYSEIMVEDISFPLLDGGHNDIMDSTGGYLIYGEEDPRETEIDIRYNYWGTVDEEEIEERIYRPAGFNFTPFDEEPNTEYSMMSGTGGGMFATALSVELDSNYVYAVSLYDSIVQLYPTSLEAKAALDRIYHLKIKTQESITTIKAYFDTLSNHTDEALATVAKRLSIRCLTADEQYQSAIDAHNLWSQVTPYMSDSIYSEVDILTNELIQSGGQLEKKGPSSIETKRLQLADFREYQRKSESILNSLFKNELQKEAQIPISFKLSQNYPNPFNPVTTIKYQLPKASKIKLEIYNILGQKVRTLVDAQQSADYYTIQWNGKNNHGLQVASGLYIYRLISETLDSSEAFVKSKKMLLIR